MQTPSGPRTAAALVASVLAGVLVGGCTSPNASVQPTPQGAEQHSTTGATVSGSTEPGTTTGAATSTTTGAATPSTVPTVPPGPSSAAPTACPRTPSTILAAPGTGRTVALTFDDGAAPATLQIAALLRSRGVPATFFDVGRQDDARPAVVQQLAAWGFRVEDHSWDHRYPAMVRGGWTVSYLRDQITRTADLQQRLTGQRPCFFRPPGGFTTNVRQAAYGLGLSVVLWSLDTLDWRQPPQTTAQATAAIVARATAPGGQQHPIILMHAGKSSPEPDSVVSPYRGNTVAALPAIIDWYAAHGYRFVGL